MHTASHSKVRGNKNSYSEYLRTPEVIYFVALPRARPDVDDEGAVIGVVVARSGPAAALDPPPVLLPKKEVVRLAS